MIVEAKDDVFILLVTIRLVVLILIVILVQGGFDAGLVTAVAIIFTRVRVAVLLLK